MSNGLKVVIAAAAVYMLAVDGNAAFAEGGCPQGMYPIGGQGVSGCAPMGAADAAPPTPRPLGRWLETWGAIARSENGMGSPVKGERSKASASRRALSMCKENGGVGCKIAFTYENQCVAVIQTSPGRGNIFMAHSTVRRASDAGIGMCKDTGGSICEVVYSDCTEPLFIRY